MTGSGYKIGGIVTDTLTGIRSGSVASISTTRTALTDNNGSAFVVTAGKTFYIGKLIVHTSTIVLTLMYDNDGAGTGEIVIAQLMSDYGDEYSCVIPVPAGKHLTAKVSAGSGTLTIVGQEV